MITGLACSLSVSVSLYSARASSLPSSSVLLGFSPFRGHPSFLAASPFFSFRLSSKVYDTFDEGYADRRRDSSDCLALPPAPDWDDVARCPIPPYLPFIALPVRFFSIFARRILRADGAKGEGAAAPVRYDGDGGRAFHLPDLSPAPSPEVPLNNNFDRQIGVVHISGFDRYLAKLSALPAVPLCDGRATRRLKPGNQPAGSPRTKQRFAFSSRLPWPRSFLVRVEPRVVLLPLFPTIFHFSQDALRCRSEIS